MQTPRRGSQNIGTISPEGSELSAFQTPVASPGGYPRYNVAPTKTGWRRRQPQIESAQVAKLYFYYSSMNAGKSTILLQSSYNYRERGMQTLLLTPEIDSRAGDSTIASRIGIQAQARIFAPDDNLLQICKHGQDEEDIRCVFVDEGQFLTQSQVHQLSDVADYLGIPVVVYGLRTDFQGNLFEGSTHLLAWADKLAEIKTICHCGQKATMVLRLDSSGRVVRTGEQIEIGGNDRYVSVCRTHFKSGTASAMRAEAKGAGKT